MALSEYMIYYTVHASPYEYTYNQYIKYCTVNVKIIWLFTTIYWLTYKFHLLKFRL